MPEDADVILAQLLLSRRFVEIDQLHEAVEYQRHEKAGGRSPGSLGDVLVAKGALSREKLEELQNIGSIEVSPAKKRFANYEIHGKLGRGGMGAVFKAVDTDSGETIALKILPPASAKEEDSHLERFLREARVALTLSHPNIVQGKKLGNVKGIYYYAMEYIDGKSVADVLDGYGLMDEGDALEIVRQICRGLEYAAEHNIVHRDVKPDNILITRDGVAKLADLGLAKGPASDARVTASGITLGTPHYISPEQVRGEEDIDVRSDIYALGISLYEMVTGGPPFDGDSMGVVIAKQLSDAIPPARDVRPDLSIATEYIIDNMTQKDRKKRYQTPAAVIKEIDGLTGKRKRPRLKF
ncbi:MAG: serine/threonine protein kinase [Planctomycetota bacterium]|nr:MAG: serine/threonine protein kinase [Planctomycetota bacterium]